MSIQFLLWLIVLVAIIHIVEEYLFGFIEIINKFISGITIIHFIVINLLFVSLCITGAIIYSHYQVFGLSVVFLIMINAFIHIMSSLIMKKYTPGTASAVILYIPLAFLIIYRALKIEGINQHTLFLSASLGFGWMTFPLLFQVSRIGLLKFFQVTKVISNNVTLFR